MNRPIQRRARRGAMPLVSFYCRIPAHLRDRLTQQALDADIPRNTLVEGILSGKRLHQRTADADHIPEWTVHRTSPYHALLLHLRGDMLFVARVQQGIPAEYRPPVFLGPRAYAVWDFTWLSEPPSQWPAGPYDAVCIELEAAWPVLDEFTLPKAPQGPLATHVPVVICYHDEPTQGDTP